MDKKLYILASVIAASFITMILLIFSPYSETHYFPEIILMFSMGYFCAQLCEDEDTLGLSMTLPIVVLFALKGLFIPVCLVLITFFDLGLWFGLRGRVFK